MKRLLWKLVRNGGTAYALGYLWVSNTRNSEPAALLCTVLWLLLMATTIGTHKFPEGNIGDATASRWFTLNPLARLLILVSVVWMALSYFVQSGSSPRMGIVVMPVMALWALYFGFKHLVVGRPDEPLDPGMEKLLVDLGLGLDGQGQSSAPTAPVVTAAGSVQHLIPQEHIPDAKERERDMDELIRRMKGAAE